MRRILLFLVVGSTFFLSGCLDILEEVHLNKDGSGKYVIAMDLSSLFSDPMMKGMAEEMFRQQAEGESGPLEMDTVISLSDIPMEELEKKEQDILQNLIVKLQASEANKKMLITMEYAFDDLAELAELGKLLEKQSKNQSGPGSMMGAGLFPKDNIFKLKKRTFTRLPIPAIDKAMAQDENAEMAKLFLADAAYKTIYYLPGKVKSTSIENAKIDGNTVTVQYDFLEVMDGDSKMEGEIKFKRK